MNKKVISILLVLSVLTFLVVGCGGQQATEQTEEQQAQEKETEQQESEEQKVTEAQKAGGTFYGRLASDPPDLDPAHTTDTTSSRVVNNIFDGLVKFNKNLEITPALAKDWEVNEEGTVWTFHLREGAKFHNGDEVTAEDVVYSYTRLLDPDTKSERAWLFERVKGAKKFQEGEADQVAGLEATGDYTVKIKLSEPFAPFLSMLGMSNAVVVPEDVVKEKGEDFAQNPVGAGPFEFVSWKHDSKVVLKKNEDYYEEGKPYLDEVVYRVITEGTSALPEYEQGNVYQMDSDIPQGQIEKVMDPEGEFADEYRKVDRLGTYYIGFNTQKEPFTNKKVRQALNYAVNKQMIAEVIRNGTVNPARSILPPGMPGYNPDLEGYPYDIEKAKELLKEAGYEDGLPGTYELAYNTSKAHQRVAEAIQSNLKKIGVDVKIVNMEWGSYISKVDNGNTQMFRLGWIADYPDPDNFLRVLFHSDNAGPGGNGAFYKNSEVDKMLEKAVKMSPGQERLDLYQKIEKQIMNDAPWIPVYYYSTPVLVKPFVHNYEFTAQVPLPLTNVWLEEGHKTQD